MAEGWLRHLAGDRYEATSAGTRPVGLNQDAVEAMREVGVDISSHTSKNVDQFLGERFDHVVTVCDRAKETCPTFPGARSLLHWSFDDPAAAQGSPEERRQVFRRVRDEIATRIRLFLTSATART
nr:arsenate reductase ArsC [Nitrospirota bacterium]